MGAPPEALIGSGIYVGRVDFTVRDGKVTAHAGRLLDLRDESLA